MNPAEKALATLLTERLGPAGKVRQLTLGQGTIEVTLDLAGQSEAVTLRANGLSWESKDNQLILRWQVLESSLAWLQHLLHEVSNRMQRQVTFADSLKWVPLKLIMPKFKI
jgi:hypothetical protein